MIEMFCPEHQMIIFREFKARWAEFDKLDCLDAFKRSKNRTTPKEYQAAIDRKKKENLASYNAQLKLLKNKK